MSCLKQRNSAEFCSQKPLSKRIRQKSSEFKNNRHSPNIVRRTQTDVKYHAAMFSYLLLECMTEPDYMAPPAWIVVPRATERTLLG